MALTRDEVVATAIRLLDEDGLSGLTLRRLAKELGISAPTLYWHVKDKRELLDLMAERIVADHHASNPLQTAGFEWWEIIAEGLRSQYHALIAHRDGAQVVAGNRPTESGLPMVERWLGIWSEAGFPADEALGMILAAGNYVLGAALEYQAETERALLRKEKRPPDPVKKQKYPNLACAIHARWARPVDPHATFEQGLLLLITGIRTRLAEIKEAKARPQGPHATSPEKQDAGT